MKINRATFPALLSFAMAIGLLLGYNLSQGKKSARDGKWEKIDQILQYVEEDYVDTISRKSLEDDVIAYLLQRLDPHSYYITEDDISALNEPLDGGFQGIGIQFNFRSDTVYVINTIKGGPSEQAGILPGDKMIAVNDETIAGMHMATKDVMLLLKGESGSTVEVAVLRGKKELKFDLTREEIALSSIDAAYLLNDTTIYVRLARFSKHTEEDFQREVYPLKSASVNHVILDLRGNGGGYLEAASSIADEFLTDGQLITYTEGKSRARSDYYASSNGRFESVGLSIIIDGTSASASEIIAGAIQDHHRGIIYGQKSFGKGLVQEQNEWSDGSATRLTVARYYTPNGRSIQRPYDRFQDKAEYYGRSSDSLNHGGIEPDIVVERDTTGVTWLYAEMVHRGFITDFVYQYRDKNYEGLKGLSFDQFVAQENDGSMLIALQLFLKKKEFEVNEKEWQRSVELIHGRTLALLARALYGDEAYYRLLNLRDENIKAILMNIKKPEL
jgi:carboxyl-terminal processing protease